MTATRQPRPGDPWWGRLRGQPADAALAVAVAIIQVAVTRHAGEVQGTALGAGGAALLAAGGLALALRRRHAVAVLGTTLALTIAYQALDAPDGPVYIAVIIAFFTAHTRGHRAAGFAALALGYGVCVWLLPLLGDGQTPGSGAAVFVAAWLLVVAAIAEAVRARRAAAEEARRRAADADQARAEEARRRQGEERLRIARDLHDVLAHDISLISVQAGVALHMLDERPEQARDSLTAIRDASKDALSELRSVLAALRTPGEAAPRAPAPGIGGIEEIAARARAAGLPVQVEIAGEPRALPAQVDLAAFRIVQEAVTNVIRHAGPGASATVALSHGTDELTVQVDDDGRGAGAPAGARHPGGGSGSGLVGMSERVAALGGSVEHGPRAGGGFRVLARIPLDGTS